ncbi:MAG: glycosyltransferase [Bacteroidota bacterium]
MEKDSDIEVLIPVYNCRDYIVKCIDSVKSQTLTNKISIIDDCSTDSVTSILKQYEAGDIRVNFNTVNKGNLKTINELLRKSTSNYIALQDADDWSNEERLVVQMDFMNKNGLDFCFTNFIKTDNIGQDIYCGYFKDTLITKDNVDDVEPTLAFASILFKREIYESIGGFDEYFDRIGGADIDWFYRAFAAGFKGGIIKKPLYYYRNNDVSYTSTVSLDPRKYISVEIARYFHKYRTLNKTRPHKEDLNDFIATQLKKINFNAKSNLKDYVVQATLRNHYLSAFKYLSKYLLTKPLNIHDLKLIKYVLHKIKSGK